MVKIPSRLEDLYPASAVEKVLDALQQPDISGKVREALDRVGMRDANPVGHMQQAFRQARSWFESFTSGESLIGRHASLINATGSLLTPNITRLPISTAVAHAHASAAVGYQNAGFSAAQASETLSRLLGHAQGSWHICTTDAVSKLLSSKQVLIAKRDLVRIPGLGDLSVLLGGCHVHEVGATNGCSGDDWQQALEDAGNRRKEDATTGGICVLLVSPNGLSGELADVGRRTAIQCAKKAGMMVVELVADGVISEQLSAAFNFPNLKRRLNADVDVVIAPLQLLVGAPIGALVYGLEREIVPLKRKATLGGTALTGPELLAAVAALRLGESDKAENGPAASLLAHPENLRNRAERLAVQARANRAVQEAAVVEREVSLGPPPWDAYKLHNAAVAIKLEQGPEQFRDRLLSPGFSVPSEPAEDLAESVGVSIAADVEDDRVLLDLRFVDPKDDHLIALAFAPESESGNES